MNFLCLGYYDEKAFNALSPQAVQDIVKHCPPLDAALAATGKLLSVASLGASKDSRCLRPSKGKTVVTDGPFIETKEVIGSFFLIEAADMNEALEIASKHPAAQLGEQVGWGVEVRPIEHCRTQGDKQ